MMEFNYQFTFLSWILFGSTLVGIHIVIQAWVHRSTSIARALFHLETAVVIWTLAAAFEAAATTVALKLFWTNVSYLGIASVPLLYLLFALCYGQHEKYLKPNIFLWLSVIPVVTFLIVITNDWHHLYYTHVSISEHNIGMYSHGPLFWIYTIYAYSMLIGGVLILVYSIGKNPGINRPKAILIILGGLFPFAGNIIYVFDFNPVPGLEWTPITFIVSGLFLLVGISRFQLLRVLPIARHQVTSIMKEAILISDVEGNIVDVNQRLVDIFGLRKKEVLNRRVDMVFHDQDELVSLMQQNEDSHSQIDIHGEHDVRCFEVQITNLYTGTNQFTGKLVLFYDITPMKKITQKLSQSESRLKEAQAVAKIGSWEFDIQTNELMWSDEIFEIFEVDQNQFESTYQSFINHVHPEDREFVDKAYTRSVKEKKPYDIDHRIVLDNGTIKFVNEKCETYYDNDGTAIRSIGTVQDVTRQVEDDKKLQAYYHRIKGINSASRTLTSSLDFLTTIEQCVNLSIDIFDASDVTIFLVDEKENRLKPRFNIGPYNKEIMAITLSMGEGISGDVTQSGKARIVNRIDLLDTGKHVKGTPYEPESLMCAPLKIDNNILGVMTVSKLGFDEFQPEDLEFLENLSDISAAAIQNARLYEASKQSEKIKTLFLANMSHEIRTPLNAIVGYNELIQAQLGDVIGEEEKHFFNIIQNSTDRLLKTIHGVLDISQMEAKSFDILEEPINLSEITQFIVDEFKPQAREKGLSLEYETTEQNTTIHADKYCIQQSLSNLLENAIKYTQSGGVRLCIFREEGNLALSIKDTGIGMSDKYQGQLYDYFSQESVGFTRKYQGAGLGLALTKRYLDMCKVSIDVKSKKGSGTEFLLRFN